MKFSSKCPKCSSHEVVRIKGDHAFGKPNQNYIQISMIRKVLVTRYACIDCGFTEEWIDREEDLKRLAKTFNKDTRGDFDEFV